MIGAVLGAGAGIAADLYKQKQADKQKRIQEGFVREQQDNLTASQEANRAVDTSGRQARMALEDAQASALQGAGSSANVSGGDVGGNNLNAVKAAMTATGATAGTSQALAQNEQQAIQQQQQKNAQSTQNAQTGAQIGDMVAYKDKAQNNFLAAAQAGVNTLDNLHSFGQDKGSGDEKNPLQKAGGTILGNTTQNNVLNAGIGGVGNLVKGIFTNGGKLVGGAAGIGLGGVAKGPKLFEKGVTEGFGLGFGNIMGGN